jgi:hypothetical protein
LYACLIPLFPYQTPAPTPAGDAGFKWWYFTHASVSVKLDPDAAPDGAVAAVLNEAFLAVLLDMMYPDMSVDMESAVRVGKKYSDEGQGMQAAGEDEWLEFTLEV